MLDTNSKMASIIKQAVPEKVLSSLNKRIDKSMTIKPIFDHKSLLDALEAIKTNE